MFVSAVEETVSVLRDKLIESQCLSVTSHDLTDEDLFQAALCVCSYAPDVENAKQLLDALGLYTEKPLPTPLGM